MIPLRRTGFYKMGITVASNKKQPLIPSVINIKKKYNLESKLWKIVDLRKSDLQTNTDRLERNNAE